MDIDSLIDLTNMTTDSFVSVNDLLYDSLEELLNSSNDEDAEEVAEAARQFYNEHMNAAKLAATRKKAEKQMDARKEGQDEIIEQIKEKVKVEEICAVCLCGFEGTIGSCECCGKHIFCLECLSKLLEKDSCPLCRGKIGNVFWINVY